MVSVRRVLMAVPIVAVLMIVVLVPLIAGLRYMGVTRLLGHFSNALWLVALAVLFGDTLIRRLDQWIQDLAAPRLPKWCSIMASRMAWLFARAVGLLVLALIITVVIAYPVGLVLLGWRAIH